MFVLCTSQKWNAPDAIEICSSGAANEPFAEVPANTILWEGQPTVLAPVLCQEVALGQGCG
jgi:hypothetical protein